MLINFIIYLSFFSISLANFTGSVGGKIIDKETHQPLSDVNIVIINSTIGTSTDKDGTFIIKNIPVGSYTIQINMIGYHPIMRPNVNVTTNNKTHLNLYLEKSVVEGQAIFVNEGYFEKTQDAVVSNRTMDYEEIRSDPVGVYDIQMMMQALPSVVSDGDQSNEIIVRGGNAGENLFIMDNLEIPNPNHFGEQGTGGGPVNFVNSAFIEKIDFFAGGFPAKYGDKQSSVMDVTLREGNKEKHEIEAEANMGGVGFVAEGPIIENKASYMTSYRKSFLKYVIKSAGMTSVPEYWNAQSKLVYDINAKNKLTFNLIIGNDNINIEDESRPDLYGAEYVDFKGEQITYGLTYKSLFSSNGYYLITGATNRSEWISSVYTKNNSLKDQYIFRNNIEEDTYLKGQFVYKINNNITFNSGFNIKEGSYVFDESFRADTIYTFLYYDPIQNQYLDKSDINDYNEWFENSVDWFGNLENIKPTRYFSDSNSYIEWLSDESIDNMDHPIIGFYNDDLINPGLEQNTSGTIRKYSAFTQFKYHLNKIKLTMGAHYNNVPYNNTNQIAPRLGLSFEINPITMINFAYGLYYQTPSYWMLMNPNNELYSEGCNCKLKNSHTEQFVIGFERYFAKDTKATLEIYNKNYYDIPIRNSDISEDSLDQYIGRISVGTENSRGVELFLQKKYSNNWYTTLSYSNSVSIADDPRPGKEGETYSKKMDYGQVMTFLGGYKLHFRQYDWYNTIRSDNFLKYLLYLPIMPSDILEISFRYRYMGGRPYTPRSYLPQHREWVFSDNWNSERYNFYSRLDIMILRRFNFNKINIITFLDLQNVFNRNNQWEYVHLPDGRKEMAYQYKQLPVAGVTIEF